MQQKLLSLLPENRRRKASEDVAAPKPVKVITSSTPKISSNFVSYYDGMSSSKQSRQTPSILTDRFGESSAQSIPSAQPSMSASKPILSPKNKHHFSRNSPPSAASSLASSPGGSPRSISAQSLERLAGLEIQHILNKTYGVNEASTPSPLPPTTSLRRVNRIASEEDILLLDDEDTMFDVEMDAVNNNSYSDEHMREPRTITVFDFDEDETTMSHAYLTRRFGAYTPSPTECQTPPTRADNPLVADIRFCSGEVMAMRSPNPDIDGAELGLFRLSPANLCSSH